MIMVLGILLCGLAVVYPLAALGVLAILVSLIVYKARGRSKAGKAAAQRYTQWIPKR